MQGRMTGFVGQRRAATFISEKISAPGLKPLGGTNSFFQESPINLSHNFVANIESHQNFSDTLDRINLPLHNKWHN